MAEQPSRQCQTMAMDALTKIGRNPLEDPPYSPDLIPWDFWAFVLLKLAVNGLQHVFEKWVERCKKCIAFQWRYFKKKDRLLTSTKFGLGLIRWVHELCNRPSYTLHSYGNHEKNGSFMLNAKIRSSSFTFSHRQQCRISKQICIFKSRSSGLWCRVVLR
jgi:hypothetical protein